MSNENDTVVLKIRRMRNQIVIIQNALTELAFQLSELLNDYSSLKLKIVSLEEEINRLRKVNESSTKKKRGVKA